MTHEEKKTSLQLARRRYAELKGRKQKGSFLDQFCAMTGMHRKSALRALSSRKRKQSKRGRPVLKTHQAVRKLLFRIRELAGRPCALLLKPVLPLWVSSLRRAGEHLDEEVVRDMLGMSVRTI